MASLLVESVRWNQLLVMVGFIVLVLCVHFFVLEPMRRRLTSDRERLARRTNFLAKISGLSTAASAANLAVFDRNTDAASAAVQHFEDELNRLSSTDELFPPSARLLAAAKQACDALALAEQERIDRDTLHFVQCYLQWSSLANARMLAEVGDA